MGSIMVGLTFLWLYVWENHGDKKNESENTIDDKPKWQTSFNKMWKKDKKR
jgi:hypothetical protein